MLSSGKASTACFCLGKQSSGETADNTEKNVWTIRSLKLRCGKLSVCHRTFEVETCCTFDIDKPY